MSYLSFLSTLTALGAKLPQVLAALQALSEWYTTYVVPLLPAKAATRAAKLKAKPRTAKELKAEQAVLSMLAAHSPAKTRAIGDGKILTVLRTIWEFAQAHPELLALLFKLIGVGV